MNDAKPEQQGPAQSEGEVNWSARRKSWAEKTHNQETLDLLARDEKHFLHQSVSTPCMSAVRNAEGVYLEDVNGRRYMDFHGNNVHHIGYGHPDLKKAITRQMDDLSFAPRRFTCEPAVALAEKLSEISPGNLSKVLFATGGSDANEIALKLARAATGRFKTVSFWDAFHGAGFGASSVGGEQLFRGAPIGPLLPGSEHIAPFGCYRCVYGHTCDANGQPDLDVCGLACAKMVRYVLEKEGDIGAVIAEPARAVPYLPPKGFWQEVRKACDEFGTLLIFDEIPTGLGKTGKMFACDHDGVEPDMIVMGKALGGGMLPIAATLVRPDLDVAGEFAFGHYTHEKNPITTRAALATIEIIERENMVENAAVVGAYALDRLEAMKEKYRLIGDVRGRGMLFGCELVLDRDAKTPANDAAEEVFYRVLDDGLSFKITMGNVLTFTPPLITTHEQMDWAMNVVETAIAGVNQDLFG